METKDQLLDELQILSLKVISVRPSRKDEVNEALKTQFAFCLHGSLSESNGM